MRLLSCICLFVSLVTTVTQAQSKYYFIFKARGVGETYWDCPPPSQPSKQHRSLTGHAFVSLVRQDQTLQQTMVDVTWGFVPNKRGLMAMVSTPGHAETTCIGDLGSSDFAVEVDRVTYEYAKKLKSKWVAKQYGIIDNVNCVDFVKAMLDLVTPEVKMPSELPMKWMYPDVVQAGATLAEQWYRMPKPFLNEIKVRNPTLDIAARQSLANPNAKRTETIIEQNIHSNTTPEKKLTESKNILTPQPAPTQKSNLLGGSNPEALGKTLLRALQNNDLNMWMSCIHPIASERHRELMNIRFNQFRTELNEEGLTDWSQVRFSRVTFKTAADFSEPGIGKAANLVSIEFLYKNGEYIGQVTAGVFATEPNKNTYYVLRAPLQNVSLRRNKSD